MPTRHPHHALALRAGATALAALSCAALVALAGSVHAQPARDQAQPVPPPEEAAEEASGEGDAARERSREEREAALRQIRRPTGLEAQPAPTLPVVDALGDDEVSFASFTEPVDLQALVDFVAKRLQVNIIVADGAVTGQVVFRAPMKVKERDLIPLLQLLLEPNGYTLTRDEQIGVLVIHPTAKLPVNLGTNELSTTQVFPTPLVRPSSLQPAINALVSAESQQMRIVYVDELGVIVSTASPRQNRAIGEVIDLVISGIRGQRLHRFDLTYVAALEARQRILELIGQVGAAGTRGGAAAAGATPAAAPVAAPGGGGSMSNLSDRLVLDRMGNSLFFRGDDAEADQVRQFVELVDAPSRLIIRRYSAGPLSPVIASYGERLGLGPVSQGAAQATGAPGAAAGAPGAAQQSGTGAGSGFVTDPGDPESFTFYGTAQQHTRVEELIQEFAEQARGEILRIEFYKLRHARAAQTAETLTQLLEASGASVADSPLLPRSLSNTRGLSNFQGGSTRTGLRGARGGVRGANPATGALPSDAGASATGAEGDADALIAVEGLSITADEPNNQLIVRAPARQQATIRDIINKLDQRRPQVYIQVQIVTVNRSRDFEFGVDWALDSERLPFFTNFGVRGGTDPFADTLSASALTAGGVTAAVVRSNYIPFIINTMETKGEGRVMSMPRLLVNDNEEATIASTTDEPFATTTQTAGAPSQTGLGGTLSAGTTLNIRPQVSEAGFMVLEFEVELSSFGERPNPDLPPTRRSDNLQSIVTIPADSTVVIGGLTFEDFNSSKNQFPWLGDIPLLGYMFGSYSDGGSTRTLYVFITPRILRDPTFADLRLLTRGPMTEVEVDEALPELSPSDMPVIFDPLRQPQAPAEAYSKAPAPPRAPALPPEEEPGLPLSDPGLSRVGLADNDE